MNNKILSIHEVVPNVFRLVIEAPTIAKKARAGQFVILMSEEDGERLPFTLCDWDREKGTITLNILEVGLSTCRIGKMKSGDRLYSVSGPLGRPSTLTEGKCVFLGGGCYGIGAIYPLARELKNKGNKVITAVEGRTDYLLYMKEKLKEVSDQYYEITVLNPSGRTGKVKDIIEELLSQGEKIDLCYFMGCSFMMMKASEATRPHKIKTYVYLDSLMLDGTGMCGCCRVTVGGETKFACVDGPEFDGHQVDWDEFFLKKGYYFEEEVMVYQHHNCRRKRESQENGGRV
ncbi:MAG TPA: sulfide/dihydroorotate dehydrogenase-like FAD/NAD-binding protein [Thermoplasmata archaeon]|nr:sulfide/dihydroorotate dehydrogenase-like FAD/NAD-binding protein [Thermoplasmata archaeon]